MSSLNTANLSNELKITFTETYIPMSTYSNPLKYLHAKKWPEIQNKIQHRSKSKGETNERVLQVRKSKYVWCEKVRGKRDGLGKNS